MIMLLIYKNEIFNMGINQDLISFSKAMSCVNSKNWKDAIKGQLQSMEQNDVLVIVVLLEGSK